MGLSTQTKEGLKRFLCGDLTYEKFGWFKNNKLKTSTFYRYQKIIYSLWDVFFRLRRIFGYKGRDRIYIK